MFYTRNIAQQFLDGQIDIGKALELVIRNLNDDDASKWKAIGIITKRQLEIEAFLNDIYAQDDEEPDFDRHGPHGKRCYCSECTEAEYRSTPDGDAWYVTFSQHVIDYNYHVFEEATKGNT